MKTLKYYLKPVITVQINGVILWSTINAGSVSIVDVIHLYKQ